MGSKKNGIIIFKSFLEKKISMMVDTFQSSFMYHDPMIVRLHTHLRNVELSLLNGY